MDILITQRFRAMTALGAIVAAVLTLSVAAWPVTTEQATPDLTSMSLEELMQTEVTTVARGSQTLWDSAAAVYVISQEDIRRSGATSIADALRMVPGMQVASINSHMWAITARGFEDRFANKMLVLIDGRSVYTPLFSGTWWDAQDTLLEDIERIEVIRGPGATMWGANAVNGVINIITKKAADATGTLMALDSGSGDRSLEQVRYGGSLAGDKGAFKIYAKNAHYNSFADAAGGDANDAWSQARAGFRMDRVLSDTESLTIHGDIYDGDGSQRFRDNSYVAPYSPIVVDDYTYSGANLLTRWTRARSDSDEDAFQLYYDRTKRDDIQNIETRNTWDFDFQSRRALNSSRGIVWGLGYRYTNDSIEPTALSYGDPPSRADQLFTAFVQEERKLASDKLRLTCGTKLEHNDYTGFEVQPSIRLLWQADEKQVVWGAVSHAVRTPSAAEREGVLILKTLPPGGEGVPYAPTFFGSDNLDSEKMTSCELGYRIQPASNLTLDVAAYYSDYDRLRTYRMGTPYLSMTPVPNIIVPYNWTNDGYAESRGIEVAASWEPSQSWRLSLSYANMSLQTGIDYTGVATAGDTYERNSPPEQYSIRSYLDLSDHMQLDTMLYVVGGVVAHHAPRYRRVDMRLGWQGHDGTSLDFVVQNMFDDRHQEFGGTLSEIPVEATRTVYLKLNKSY